MKSSYIQEIFYREDPEFEGFLIVIFFTDQGVFEISNCELKTVSGLVNKNDYTIFENDHFLNHKVIDVRVSFEMELFIRLEKNRFITIFRDSDFNLEGTAQTLDMYVGQFVDNSFLESFNESDSLFPC